MTDKELLLLAAKAAGIDMAGGIEEHGTFKENWNPLENSEDAFELAVELEMCVDCDNFANLAIVFAKCGEKSVCACLARTAPAAAIRRAIVLVAAGRYD